MPFLLKRFLFRTHWLFGILAGIVLAVVGVTGALLSYEKELLDWLNPQFKVAPAGREALTPDTVIARVMQAHPELSLRSFGGQSDPTTPYELRLARGAERGGVQVFVDPYTGADLGTRRGADFFHTSEQLHRFLAAGPVGKQIVGASTVALILLAISGVVLRWPRRWRSPRAWLLLDTKLRGRSLLWHLHAILGTWALLFYLLAAFTGLWWSYEFYRNAVNSMAGVPTQGPPRGQMPPGANASPQAIAPPSLDRAYAAFRAATPEAERFSVNLGPDPKAPLEWRYFTAESAHDRAADTLRVNGGDGSIVARQPYAELPRGRRFVSSMLPLHTGSWFGPLGRFGMALASFAMPLFAVTGLWLWLQRRKRERAAKPAVDTALLDVSTAAVQVIHAGQSGTAERLAWRTAQWLREIGVTPQVRPLSQWQPAADGVPALFVLATYGDGGPPDSALGFSRRWLKREATPDLSTLECGVLALGNRRYEDFCGFGKRFAHWLGHAGAKLWFDRVDAHEADAGALQHWREGLARRWPALAHIEQTTDDDATLSPWTLRRRQRLNPRSDAAALCELELVPACDGAPTWQPGDLIEVVLDNDEPRPYSLASLPGDGYARLLVRQLRDAQGKPGRASDALCDWLESGAVLQARLRRSPAFAPPAPQSPVVLIANGVGIAPFLALLRQRAGSAPAWLIYGERHPDTDAALIPELQALQRDGALQRLDLAWSRGEASAYVQDRLREQIATLRDWLARGATLMVCGSPEMGAAVERLLLDQFGDADVEVLRDAGRYRRELF